jgi:hypothetical protein
MLGVSTPTAPTGQASRQGHAAGDDQSDFPAADTRGRAMSDGRITETMPVELLRDARDIYGIGLTEPHDLEALAWSCGIDTDETYIPAAPAADHSARFAQDRAAVVTRAILQIVCSALIAWLHGEHADMAGARDAIEALLRDEFSELARTTFNEFRLRDG